MPFLMMRDKMNAICIHIICPSIFQNNYNMQQTLIHMFFTAFLQNNLTVYYIYVYVEHLSYFFLFLLCSGSLFSCIFFRSGLTI